MYSCHVSPDGQRLVTAAGGESYPVCSRPPSIYQQSSDAHVRIWSTEAIKHSADPDFTKPKQLAAISTHSGTIHCVRFSGNNKYLASGADDKIVCIYGLDPNPPAHAHTFGSNEPPPVENWRVLRRLIGHDNDVQDLGWSYDSSILVSVGLDSKVVVWSGHTFEKLKTLSHHQSHVKGITFDPANKYFATASDDRSIKIFRFTSPAPNATAHDQVNNFMLEATITTPFVSSPLTTYFRRCSWSPDGNHIAAANAVNGPVSSVAIINRGSWDSDINLIGHEGPVEVCAFSPRMFYREPLGPQHLDAQGHANIPSVTVIACAGQDKTLSVWNTSFARPFVVTQELCTKSISDLAWSPDGETLYFTSLDGGIIAAIFEPGELGYPAPLQENEKALTKYGAGRKAGIIEGVDALLLEDMSKAGELKGVQGRMGELMGDGNLHPAPAVNGATNGTAPTTNGNAQANGQTPPPPVDPQKARQEQKVQELKSRVEIVNGKKRIKPLLISSSSNVTESANIPQPQLLSSSVAGTRTGAGPADLQPTSILDLSKPYDGLPKGGLATLLLGTKRKYAEIAGDPERRIEKRLGTAVKDGSAPVVMNTADGLVPPALAERKEPELPDSLRPAMTLPHMAVSSIRLAVPVVRSVIVRQRDLGALDPKASTASGGAASSAGTDETVMLEARNATGPSRTGRSTDRDPTRVNCTRHGQSLWQDYLPKPVLLLTGNANFWAAGCEDGTLYLWTPAGRRMMSAMLLSSTPVIMDCRGDYLMVITAIGFIHVWDVKSMTALSDPVHIAPILDAASAPGDKLTQGPSIIFARLNSRGAVVVTMSDGSGWTYSLDMKVWLRLSEPWWAVGSQYWSTTDSSVNVLGSASSSSKKGKEAERDDEVAPENLSAGIIPLLERNTTMHALARGRAFFLQRLMKALLVAEGFEGFEANVSIAHLENRVAAAMELGAREEFKVYLLMYAKRLGAEGLKGKIEELLRTLAGRLYVEADEEEDGSENKKSMGARKNGSSWFDDGDKICGWPRMKLLKEVVLVLGEYI